MSEELKTLKEIDMVIMYKNRYFGINFSIRKIEEISFDEGFGYDFFDWDNMICMANDYNKLMYDEMRGKKGLGFGKICQMVEVKDE